MKNRREILALTGTVSISSISGCSLRQTANDSAAGTDLLHFPSYTLRDDVLICERFSVSRVSERRSELNEADIDVSRMDDVFKDRFLSESIDRDDVAEMLTVTTERPEGALLKGVLLTGEFEAEPVAEEIRSTIDAEPGNQDDHIEFFATSDTGDSVGYNEQNVAFGREETAVRQLLRAQTVRSDRYFNTNSFDPTYYQSLENYSVVTVFESEDPRSANRVTVYGYEVQDSGSVSVTVRHQFPNEGFYEQDKSHTVDRVTAELDDPEVRSSEENHWVIIDGVYDR